MISDVPTLPLNIAHSRLRVPQTLVITSPILATDLGAGSLRPSPGRGYDLDTCPYFKAAGRQQRLHAHPGSRGSQKAGWPHPHGAYKAALGKSPWAWLTRQARHLLPRALRLSQPDRQVWRVLESSRSGAIPERVAAPAAREEQARGGGSWGGGPGDPNQLQQWAQPQGGWAQKPEV